MLTVRKAEDRGHASHGWLDSWHTFSFAQYRDPQHMGFRDLRVINEDTVQPGRGFGTHSHRDMEIITYVLEGALEHKDSLGNGSVIRPGDVQRMSAGRGVRHSEFNASHVDQVHFLQIWIEPNVLGVEPGYAELQVPVAEKRGRLRLIASPEGHPGSVTLHQDAWIYAAVLDGSDKVTHNLVAGRQAWVQVARGSVKVNGEALAVGDGASIIDETRIEFSAADRAEFLLFDLA
jgi:quercetin 2,3-dioxygenase